MGHGRGEMLGQRVGKYVLTRVIGAGGMGVVYEAEHRFLGARVAIKVLGERASAKRESLERFCQEARTIAAIDHEGIVGVFDLELTDDGRPCIIMEKLDGASLDKLIAQRGTIRPDILIRWMSGWVDALAATHRAGVVHRDLKPGNLFVTRTGRTEVLDFGIAKLMPKSRDSGRFTTLSGQVFGTRPYMAPEQACGDPLDERTDVYALGVVMYEALTGKRPFRAESMMSLLTEQKAGAIPPSRFLTHVPHLVECIVMRCLAVEPAERYQSLEHLILDLEAAARSLGVARSRRESAPPGRYFAGQAPASGPVTEPEAPEADGDPADVVTAVLRAARLS